MDRQCGTSAPVSSRDESTCSQTSFSGCQSSSVSAPPSREQSTYCRTYDTVGCCSQSHHDHPNAVCSPSVAISDVNLNQDMLNFHIPFVADNGGALLGNEGLMDAFVHQCARELVTKLQNPTYDQIAFYNGRIFTRYTKLAEAITASEYITYVEKFKACIQYYKDDAPTASLKDPSGTSESDRGTGTATLVHLGSNSNDSESEEADVTDASNTIEFGDEDEEDLAESIKLMMETYNGRREWIEQKATGCKEIVQKFPLLKNDQMILAELSKIFGITDIINDTFQNFEKLVLQLADKLDITDRDTDKDIVDLLQIVYKQTAGKRYEKDCTPLLTIHQVDDENPILCDLDDAPHAHVFFKGNDIAKLVIMAEGDELVTYEEDDISAHEVAILLIGVYYVFFIEYPLAYQGLLFILQTELLKRNEKPKYKVNLATKRLLK